jgi:hypothetical protein
MNEYSKPMGPHKKQTYINGIDKGEEGQAKEIENIFSKITENFPNLGKDDIQLQRSPNRHDQKRTFPHHIRVKPLIIQNKEKVLKAAEREVLSHL